MRIVGNLRAKLGLDARDFNQGLKRAESRTGRFAKAASRNIALVGAAMAAAAGAGIATLTRSGLAFVDQQAKVARTIDGTTDALRALQLVAGDAGVAQSELNKSMQMIGARLVEAEVKGGASAKALARLGLNAKELSALDADERLAVMADRVQELGLSSGETTQFLMDMGVRSKEMALLLRQGGDAIRSARSEIEDMGLSLSALDTAKVESANDAMSRIGLVTEAVGNRLAVAFAPTLERIAEGMTNMMREGSGVRNLIDAIGATVGRATAVASDYVTILGALINSLRGAAAEGGRLSILADVFSVATAPIRLVIAGVGEAIEIVAHLIRKTGSFGEAMAALKPLADEVWQRVGDGVDYVRASVEIMSNKIAALFVAGLRRMASGWVDFTGVVATGLNKLFKTELAGIGQELVGKLASLELGYHAVADAASVAATRAKESFGAPLASLETLRSSVRSASEDSTDALKETTDAVHELDDALSSAGSGGGSGAGSGSGASAAAKVEKIETAVERLNKRLSTTRDAMRGTFSEIVLGAEDAGDAIGKLLQRFAQMGVDRVFNSLFDRGVEAIAGSNGDGFLRRLLSFEGGGHTGMGPRIGGLDGKGGYLAMVHPRETVIDSTRFAGASGHSGGVIDLRVFSDPGVITEIARNETNMGIRMAGPGIVRQAVGQSMSRLQRTKLGSFSSGGIA
ncbi:hypothetical protein [uncultured Tateyamaria sp.]|uniref:hypothetical protein n=1 Tax=uncultured Tateyamaria sp. TaxID=455651 RepID=UPI0026378ECC|nr:hypothetical protein [uncultured Tateyamaria sp.]